MNILHEYMNILILLHELVIYIVATFYYIFNMN